MRPSDPKLIHLPSEAGQADEGEPTVQHRGDKLGVLVVDDNHMVRIMVQLGLELYRFDVWLAPDGAEALRLYRKHRERIDVVLLDVRMPGLDGPQTLDALRELDPKVLVCFMSGDLGGYRPEELRQRGAAHLLAKPFHLDQLARTLRLLVNGVPANLLASGGGCQG